MARVEVHSGTISEGRITSLDVRMHNLPPRTIDRDTALAWMKDGHSFIPVVDGEDLPRLELVEVPGEGDLPDFRIRATPDKGDEDTLPF